MYHFLNQDDDEMSIFDLFKIDNMSIPDINAAVKKESSEFNIEAPSDCAIKPSESQAHEEDKTISKLEIKREQGKVRAKRARDRK